MLAENEVTIGIIMRPHGLRGMVKVRALTDDPERYFDLARVNLHQAHRSLGAFEIERVEVSNATNVLVKFRGRDSIEAVESLRNAEIRITRAECLPTSDNQFYHFDLIGLPVETNAGRVLGTVSEILEHPGNDVWVVHDTEHNELLLPAIASVIKEVDLKRRRIVIEPLPGLFDETEKASS